MRNVLSLAILLCLSVTLVAQPPAPQVTDHHKKLQREVGVWDGQMKMWMAPDQDPQIVPLVETNTMLTGDLWLLSEFDCGPFQGRGQIGYDTGKEKYVGTWIDKGLGLVIPGFIPSPLGEVVEYTPTWVELAVTAGIFAVMVIVRVP